MSVDPAIALAVTEALQAELQGSSTETYSDFDADQFVVRIYRESQQSCEISFAEGFLEDNDAETIIANLVSMSLGSRLTLDPSMRLHVDAHGHLQPGEVMVIRCTNVVYRITRGRDHIVRVYDGAGILLPHQPPRKLLEHSIYRKLKQEWCREIVLWVRPNNP